MTEAPVALVTGASRGIGLATARLLATRGYHLVLTGRTLSPALQAACDELTTPGLSPPLPLAVDLGEPSQIAAAFRALFSAHRRLDVLVNNAGELHEALIGMSPPGTIERMFAVNAAGSLHMLQGASRLMMRRQQGSIVNLGSVVAVQGSSGQIAYAASKAAVHGMTLAAARELGPRGIRVNAVAPGVVETELIADFGPERREALRRAASLGRLVRAEEVAAAIAFLAGPESSAITGQILGVDAGLVIPSP